MTGDKRIKGAVSLTAVSPHTVKIVDNTTISASTIAPSHSQEMEELWDFVRAVKRLPDDNELKREFLSIRAARRLTT